MSRIEDGLCIAIMLTQFIRRAVALLATTLMIPLAWGADPERDRLWRSVDEALEKGLPRTAITNLEQLLPRARQARAWGEVTRAVAQRAALEHMLEGGSEEASIRSLEAALREADPQVAPMLQTLRALWYWRYFESNRWRFAQRTATGEPSGTDLATWDLRRIYAEIDSAFRQAQAASDTWKRTPIRAFTNLLTSATLPDRYRPTAYDFISQQAIEFYSSGEQGLARPEDDFELEEDSPVLGSEEAFRAWWPTLPHARYPHSPLIKALRLYGQLLDFHGADADPTARADVDLARLMFGRQHAIGEDKDRQYRSALEAFVTRWASNEIAGQALYHLARMVHEEGDGRRAHALASQGAQRFAGSVGGRMCQSLLYELESRQLDVTTERIWLATETPDASEPPIEVRYRNLTQVWFRAVRWEWEEFLRKDRPRPESLNPRLVQDLLARPPVAAWSAMLPVSLDYRERREHVAPPSPLPPGHYFLVASGNASFQAHDNEVRCTPFWVSDLALIVRPQAGALEAIVLDAQSGEPIGGAEVDAWSLDRQGSRIAEPVQTTDADGLVRFPARLAREVLLRARHGKREVATESSYGPGYRDSVKASEKAVLLTDRAIYRPGQIIRYKGILIQVDHNNDQYAALPDRRATVVLRDSQGTEIERAEHQANAFGAFSGQFNAPRDRLLGHYHVQTEGGFGGSASVRVEEYKRPTFQVTLEQPAEATQLNERVHVRGKASSYAGAAVDGAELRWRVIREMPWPEPWHFRRWPGPRRAPSQEIAHGRGQTGADGSFVLTFIAKPERKLAGDEQASFVYRIYADVTDRAGETRSAEETLHIGTVSLQAQLIVPAWLTDDQPQTLEIRTRSLNGNPQSARGTLQVYALKPPPKVQRARLAPHGWWREDDASTSPQADADMSDPSHWETAGKLSESPFETDARGEARVTLSLKGGIYRFVLETTDTAKRPVTANATCVVDQPGADTFAVRVPSRVVVRSDSVEPGMEFMALWGTGYEVGRALVEIERKGKMLRRFWTSAGRTQQLIRMAVDDTLRGGFTLHVSQVRENRAYLTSRTVQVPWIDRELTVRWETMRSKLEPGARETWTALISRRHSSPPEESGTPTTSTAVDPVVAEFVAALYDASLDQFVVHDWPRRFGVFYQERSFARPEFVNTWESLRLVLGKWGQRSVDVERTYRDFRPEVISGRGGGPFLTAALARSRGGGVALSMAAPPTEAAGIAMVAEDGSDTEGRLRARTAKTESSRAAPPTPPPSSVVPRRNLNELAFFFPHLVSESNGTVRMTFTMPEALTTWKFFGFAHTTNLSSGFLESQVTTSKDLMVQPNPPRFLREGDELEFTARIVNRSSTTRSGRAELLLRDARTDADCGSTLGLSSATRTFEVPPGESQGVTWRLRVPDQAPFLVYRVVATSGALADGEEGYLPVLPRRLLVTESLPLTIQVPAGKKSARREFRLESLARSGASRTLVHQSAVLQMVPNPSWYAVMALPYLMEFPHACAEQTFNRLYANALARHVAHSDPRIQRTFEVWRAEPESLKAPLERNEDLKSILLEETPWLRASQQESQSRKNLAVLFDDNRLDQEQSKAMTQLGEAQRPDGAWPWFPGGPADDFITLYILTGFGRLRHLGVANVDMGLAQRSLAYLDEVYHQACLRIQKEKAPEHYVPSAHDALYLYGRSFFLKEVPVAPQQQESVAFLLRQARAHWTKMANRQSQAHVALALHRWANPGDPAVAEAVLRSLKERSTLDPEQGRYWPEARVGWWWYGAPIETQALMIEALDEVTSDRQAVEECRVWLLRQKQTQNWKTTKATADAIYGLLLRGRDLLGADPRVNVMWGGQRIQPQVTGSRPVADQAAEPAAGTSEAGTGYFEVRYGGGQVRPELGRVILAKEGEGIAWGSLHWQYLEDLKKIKASAETPLQLRKSLFVRVNSPQGPVLQPVTRTLRPGDELVVKIELRVDRDMEYVHLKDQRGSGTEPTNVLSGYRYQDALGYYETTRDTATHFFIDSLRQGTHVIEYATRVQHRGKYQSGVATVQCMYAPEFNGHSESVELLVE